jgi:hypothetical protein
MHREEMVVNQYVSAGEEGKIISSEYVCYRYELFSSFDSIDAKVQPVVYNVAQ